MARKSSGSRSSGLGAIGFTLIALVFTGSTAFFLSQVLKGKNISATPMRTTVVAARDIKASEMIKKEFFKEVRLPLGIIPNGAYNSISQLFPPSSNVKPRVVVNAVYENEVILPQRLSDPKRGTGFASLVAKEFRALSLEVDSRTTRSNVVYPGAVVDILTTMRRVEQRDSVTRLVVQGVKVLAVNGISDAAELDESMRKSKKRARKDVLTILVNPDQGEALTLASNEGKIDVLLRNTQDIGSIDTQGVTTKELTTTEANEEEQNQKTKRQGKRRRSKAARNRFRRSSQPKSRRNNGRRGKSSSATLEF
ncbi:MAG: Flp pilus assembly protein CpaB [Myxococcales bacterium]|nr:Flp pilus assembly protein CpaB [Myxococcales bacterium]